jgi:uncharacterized membrane protein SpoIIM required for sporulation
MAGKSQTSGRLRLAFRRARPAIVWMACAYLGGALFGVIAVHSGHQVSLAYRDRIVSRAQTSSTILREADQGRPVAAAALDFAGNLFAATATAAAGWWAPAPFPIAVYRGWIGGIVSVDAQHHSRITATHGGIYYCLVAGLQLLGYILAGGAGVNLGLARVRPRSADEGARWLGVPVEAYRDAGYIYAFVIPIFSIASAIEFLWRG